MLKRTKLLDAGVSVAMPMLSPELDLTAAGTLQFSEQFLTGQRGPREVREIRCSSRCSACASSMANLRRFLDSGVSRIYWGIRQIL